MTELTKMLGGTCRDFVAVRPFSEIPPPALFRPVGPAFQESRPHWAKQRRRRDLAEWSHCNEIAARTTQHFRQLSHNGGLCGTCSHYWPGPEVTVPLNRFHFRIFR